MESCRGVSSSLQTSRYVSWEVESAVSPTSTTALTATAAPEKLPHQSHQPAGSGSVPLLLMSPPETSGGETNAAFSFQCPQPDFKKRTHRVTVRQSHLKAKSKEDPSLLHPGNEVFHLPRSSPVISRRYRPVSWHGGDSDTSASSSSDTPSPASGLLSPDQCLQPTDTSMEDLGSKPSSSHHSSQPQEAKKPRCVSASSGLFRLLSAGLHLPISGQQGLAEEQRQQSLTSRDATHSSGFSNSTQDSKERRCSIPEFSADTFKTSCELEKENAHFIVVDMVLEVLEGVKWTLRLDQRTPTKDTCQHTHYKARTRRHTSPAEDTSQHEDKRRCKSSGHTETCVVDELKQESNKRRHTYYNVKTSYRGTHSSYLHTYPQHTHGEEEEEEENDKAEHQPKTFSILSNDSGFEDCGVDTTLTHRDSTRNAEWLAQQLVLEFKRRWFPSHELRRGRQSLRSSLQELPGTGSVVGSSSSLAEEIKLRTRMRGSLNWAPPRFQIIFTVQPTLRRNEVVALQHFLCAGCGTEVEPKHIKKLRYCEYFGRYFCDCCHSGSEAVIPGRVLSDWDFGRYPVSDFSKQLLDSIWQQPLFDLTCVGKTLYSRVKELDKFKELQDNLLAIKKLLRVCRLSGSVMTEFEQFPAHLMEKPHLFSMDDLLKVKKGQLVVQARAVLHSAIDHVEKCELCLARGFICEFCRKRDVIFPFQTNICKRCPVCRACFHKHCFVEKKCPKCARIQSRKKRPDSTTSMNCDM